MTFKHHERNQTFLLPPSFRDFLGDGHEAVILDEFLQELDTTPLEQSYHNEHGGSSAYHPAILLAILIYGYMNGIFSSRKIAKRLRQDLAFMHLAGNTKPDFRTLARFRKEKGGYLEATLTEVIHKARELGLISFGACSLDGTKIQANASKDKNYRKDDLEKNIRTMLTEAERIDAEEDALYGHGNEDANDPGLKTKAGRERRKKELRKRAKNTETKLAKLGDADKANITDPDAKLMKMKQGKGFANAYNVQSITENGIILSNSIFTTSADQGTLIPAVQKFKDAHGKAPKRLLADKGYSSEDNYAFCEQSGIDAYIPNYSEPTDLSRYTYDKTKDVYTDPRGRIYRFKQHMEKRDGVVIRGRPRTDEDKKDQHGLYKRSIYEYRNKKTGVKKYLAVSQRWHEYVQKQKKKLASRYGRRLYRKRMHDVEGVFGNIKKNLGFTAFNLRGLAGVAAEWTLIALAHNLKKVM
ncbi:MAG: IS1182 family transposase [Patescibacteria group bacterium]